MAWRLLLTREGGYAANLGRSFIDGKPPNDLSMGQISSSLLAICNTLMQTSSVQDDHRQTTTVKLKASYSCKVILRTPSPLLMQSRKRKS